MNIQVIRMLVRKGVNGRLEGLGITVVLLTVWSVVVPAFRVKVRMNEVVNSIY